MIKKIFIFLVVHISLLYSMSLSSLDFDLTQFKNQPIKKNFDIFNNTKGEKRYKLSLKAIDPIHIEKIMKVTPNNIYLKELHGGNFSIEVLKNNLPPGTYYYYLIIEEDNPKEKIKINKRLNIKQKFQIKK